MKEYSLKISLLAGFVMMALLCAGIALATQDDGGGEIAFEEDCGCIIKGVTRVRMTPMTQFYIDTFLGDFEAKGASIRNTWSGNIILSEIPGGATIRAVYLYWMVLNPNPACSTGTFDGNALDGVLVGRDEDPCWGLSESCYVWRQEVTPWVGGNGTYAVAIDEDPGSSNDRGEGASLIALYEDAAEPEKVFIIHDGCVTLKGSLEQYSWSLTGFTADVPCTEAKTAFIIGDGQGVGQGDSMFYNGTCIDWNTTEGFDGPYWDTRTYDVTGLTPGGSNQSDYRYHPAVSTKDDCVTLGVCVLGVSRDLIGIEMTSFSAQQAPEGVVLSWRTESEMDVSHYILKRSQPGTEYEQIALIPGKGNSPQSHQYTHVDSDIEPQVPYRYLLGAVSSGGQEQWFGPVSVTPRLVNPALRVVSSNPAKGAIQFTFVMPSYGWLYAEIRNASGRLVESLASGNVSPGEQTFVWNTEAVPDGIYFIVLRGDGFTESGKVALIR